MICLTLDFIRKHKLEGGKWVPTSGEEGGIPSDEPLDRALEINSKTIRKIKSDVENERYNEKDNYEYRTTSREVRNSMENKISSLGFSDDVKRGWGKVVGENWVASSDSALSAGLELEAQKRNKAPIYARGKVVDENSSEMDLIRESAEQKFSLIGVDKDDVAKLYDIEKEHQRRIVDEIFGKRGDTITLYRGVRGQEAVDGAKAAGGPGNKVSVKLGSLSSFTTSPKIAGQFIFNKLGVVYKVQVPKDKVFSTFMGGVGSSDEREIVVEGYDIDGWVNQIVEVE